MMTKTTERLPGTRNVALRIEAAYANFAKTLVELGSISSNDAVALAQWYIVKKLAKLDPVMGCINVTHGGYLDQEAILRALEMMRG